MSRIGRMPVKLPKGVEVRQDGARLVVKGPKGEIASPLFAGIEVEIADEEVRFSLARERADKKTRAFFGTARALFANAVKGVSEGFTKVLELHGVGYRAQQQGKKIVLQLGFSHPVEYEAPADVEIKVDGATKIVVSGTDKQKVGQVAAEIRAFRPPEPYKGKGVRYAGEQILMKEGKKA